jgi:hypothetical protein
MRDVYLSRSIYTISACRSMFSKMYFRGNKHHTNIQREVGKEQFRSNGSAIRTLHTRKGYKPFIINFSRHGEIIIIYGVARASLTADMSLSPVALPLLFCHCVCAVQNKIPSLHFPAFPAATANRYSVVSQRAAAPFSFLLACT